MLNTIYIVEDDDRTQEMIGRDTAQHRLDQAQSNLLGGVEGVLEGEGGGAMPRYRDDEEDQWEEVEPANQGDNGMKVEEGSSPGSCVRRPGGSGRPGGRGRRGFWVKRREEQLNKRLKVSEMGGASPEK